MDPIRDLVDVVNGYKDKQYIEIEMRLGRIGTGGFETDIGKPMFDTLVRRLRRYTGWERVDTREDEVYYWDNGVRCVYNEESTVVCRKHKIMKRDVHTTKPFDYRFSISQEVPVDQPDDDAKRSVSRKRISFVRKNLTIDMTEVYTAPTDIDSESGTTVYQCELEIINPKLLTSNDEIYNILYKINDVLAIST